MSKGIPVTAIFDIGKTNKKFLLFDEKYQVLSKEQISFPQIKDDDGDACEDLDSLINWMNETLRQALSDQRYKIKALNFSTYGATLVHIDKAGYRVSPLYDYFKPYPEKLLQDFYIKNEGINTFSLKTASPPMGMLNSGLQLYWLKNKKSQLFKKISTSLHFPQYLSYLYTNELFAEMTSIGCHTGLWNFENKDYHSWVFNEGVRSLLPEIVPVTTNKNVVFDDNQISVGIGIHDSSASLAPYLYFIDEPFVLVSTGTWSITLNPFSENQLTFDDLERDCLNYMSVNGEMVRASRFLLGKEYDFQKEKLVKYFQKDSGSDDIQVDEVILSGLLKNESGECKLKLETVGNSGPYHQHDNHKWEPAHFQSYEEAYHQLMLDLVSIQSDAINLTMDAKEITKLFVSGGFSKNALFMRLLASKFPEKSVYAVDLSDSTALGAALVVNRNKADSRQLGTNNLLEMQQFFPLKDVPVKDYSWSYS